MKYLLLPLMAVFAVACSVGTSSKDYDVKIPKLKVTQVPEELVVEVPTVGEDPLKDFVACDQTEQGADAEIAFDASVRIPKTWQRVQHLDCDGKIVKDSSEISGWRSRAVITLPATDDLKEDLNFAKISNRRTCKSRSGTAVENSDKNLEIFEQTEVGPVPNFLTSTLVQKNGRIQFIVQTAESWVFVENSLPVREGLNKIDVQYFGQTEATSLKTATLRLNVEFEETTVNEILQVSDCKTKP